MKKPCMNLISSEQNKFILFHFFTTFGKHRDTLEIHYEAISEPCEFQFFADKSVFKSHSISVMINPANGKPKQSSVYGKNLLLSEVSLKLDFVISSVWWNKEKMWVFKASRSGFIFSYAL